MATRAAKLALRGKSLSDTGTEIGIVNNADATAITIDSSENVGIGVTPQANWHSNYDAVAIGEQAVLYAHADGIGNDSATYLGTNVYENSGAKYLRTDESSLYRQQSGKHDFYVAPSGSADAAISWTTAMTIDNAGKVGIGTSSPLAILEIDPPAVDTPIFAIRRQDHASFPLFKFFQDSSVSQGTGHAHMNTGNRDLSITTDTNSTKTNGIYINTTGNVGINTASPRALLDLGAGSGDGSLSNTPSQYQVVLAAPTGTGDYGRNIGWVETNSNIVAGINAVDNGTSSSTGLTFSTGNTSAIAERMRINSVGIVTKPYQPAFSARSSSGWTVNSTSTDMPANTVLFNTGSHYNASTYKFTAPVGGVYSFSANITYNTTDDIRVCEFAFYINNVRTYDTCSLGGVEGDIGANEHPSTNLTATMYIGASDYVTFKSTGHFTSTGTVGLRYGAFSGHLVG